MAAPRVTIDALPEKSALAGTEWFVVQDGTTSKKVSAAHVGTGGTTGGGGGGGVPDGGTTGQVLGKLSNANQATGWQSPLTGPTGPSGPAGPGVPAGGSVGQMLRKATSTDYVTAWTTLTPTDVGLSNVNNTADSAKPIFTTTTRGLVPPSGAPSSTVYLNANGAWTTPAGSAGLPPGGTVGQILGKTGSADYAVGWVADQVGSGGGVDTETVMDLLGTTGLVAGNNIDITYDDAAGGGAGAITIDVEPLTTADIAGLTAAAVMTLPVSVSNGGTGTGSLAANFLQGNGTSPVTATKAIPAGAVVGTTDVQTLTNKTIALGSNTVSGTLAQFNTNITGGGAVQNVQGAAGLWVGTQAAYDALGTWASTTLYIIT